VSRIESTLASKPHRVPGEETEPYEEHPYVTLGRLFPATDALLPVEARATGGP